MGLLDSKIYVVLARLEADFSDQPPSIPAVPNHQASLQCLTAEYPYTAAKYPCSAQPLSILAVPKCRVSPQCPTTKCSCRGPTEKYPCSAQLQSIPGAPNSRLSIFLQRICSAAGKPVEGGQGNVTLLVQ